jgi:transcriptional regulator with XRE-family HTH domain
MNIGAGLAEVLRKYRRAHGLSQAALGAMLNVDQSYISLVETGRREITDVHFLKRIVDRLGIKPFQIGLPTEVFAETADLDVLQFARSIISLAITARNSGHPEQTIQELHPLLVRLDAQLQERPSDTALLMTIAEGKTALGTALGDLLPDERLHEATGELCAALDIVNRTQGHSPSLKADLLKKIGNEKRKQGLHAEAAPLLERALAIDPHHGRRGSAALCLARLRANQHDQRGFASAVREAMVCMDRVDSVSPVFNQIAINEVRLRGAMQLGHLKGAAEIERLSGEVAVGLAPHWSVIRETTIAEAWISVGNRAEGIHHAHLAIAGALRCKLPRQATRVARVVDHPADPAFEDFAQHAREALSTLVPYMQIVWPEQGHKSPVS